MRRDDLQLLIACVLLIACMGWLVWLVWRDPEGQETAEAKQWAQTHRDLLRQRAIEQQGQRAAAQHQQHEDPQPEAQP